MTTKSLSTLTVHNGLKVIHTSGSVAYEASPWNTYEERDQTSFDNPYFLVGQSNADIGSFFSQENKLSISNNVVDCPAGNGYNYSVSGPMRPNVSGSAWPSLTPPSNAMLDAMGTRAISRVLPTNANADLSVFLGELKREGIPKIVGAGLLKSRARDFREIGGEYLNVKFGWEPFVSDLRKLSQSVCESEKILSDYRRQSGTRMRRAYSFPDEVSVVTVDQGPMTPLPSIPSGHYLRNTGWQHHVTTTVKRMWFRGCFMYYIPIGQRQIDDIARTAQEARKLLGLNLTPETVWNLTPWSWAVDWVGNIGEILHNASAFSQDGLVMNYGYMMHHTKVTRVYVNSGCSFKNGGETGPLTLTFERELMLRRKATPYGFGLNPTVFSGQRQSILAALGITNVPSRRR